MKCVWGFGPNAGGLSGLFRVFSIHELGSGRRYSLNLHYENRTSALEDFLQGRVIHASEIADVDPAINTLAAGGVTTVVQGRKAHRGESRRCST